MKGLEKLGPVAEEEEGLGEGLDESEDYVDQQLADDGVLVYSTPPLSP